MFVLPTSITSTRTVPLRAQVSTFDAADCLLTAEAPAHPLEQLGRELRVTLLAISRKSARCRAEDDVAAKVWGWDTSCGTPLATSRAPSTSVSKPSMQRTSARCCTTRQTSKREAMTGPSRTGLRDLATWVLMSTVFTTGTGHQAECDSVIAFQRKHIDIPSPFCPAPCPRAFHRCESTAERSPQIGP